MATIIAPVIQMPPSSGSYSGNAKAVRVSLEYRQKLPFRACSCRPSRPSARPRPRQPYPVGPIACSRSTLPTATGVTLQGSSTVNLGCSIAANSKGATAVYAGGSSSVVATPISAVGGMPRRQQLCRTDDAAARFRFRRTILSPRWPIRWHRAARRQAKVQPNTTATLSPGCYRGLDLKGERDAAAGTYVLDGGDFNVGAQANVYGTGVTISPDQLERGQQPEQHRPGGHQWRGNDPALRADQRNLQGPHLLSGSSRAGSGRIISTAIPTSSYQGAIYVPEPGTLVHRHDRHADQLPADGRQACRLQR